MPLYEFRCRACGEKFERLCSLSEAALPGCPKCASTDVQKLLSTFGTKAGGAFHGTPSGSGCSGCSSHNCGSCH